MRFARFGLSSLVLVFVGASVRAEEPHPAAVQVLVKRTENSTSYGSGTVIASENGRSLVLTCAHVSDGDYPTTVVAAGKSYTATRIAGSVVRQTGPALIAVDGPDLALLDVDGALTPAEIADREPARGARLRQWGFPGNRQVARSGQALGYQGARVADPVYETSLDVAQGDSGAGLFNDDNQLVAVVWGGSSGVQCCSGTTTVRQFVKVSVGPRFPRLAARFGRTTTTTTTTVQVMPMTNKPMPPVAVPAPMAKVPTNPQPTVPPVAPRPGAPAPLVLLPSGQQNCPNGVCPAVQGSPGVIYSTTSTRRGFFRR